MAEEIVDNFIGQKFGVDGHLTVVSLAPKSGTNKRYFVHCSVCAQDPELFGDATFSLDSYSIRKGALPCGCGKTHKLSTDQWEVKIKRECAKRNYTYLGYTGQWLGQKTKIRVQCLSDGHIWQPSIDNFKNRSGCPKCAAVAQSLRARTTDMETIKTELENSGNYLEGTVFTKMDQKHGEDSHWTYYCPVCSNDEYVQNGLCTGVFSSSEICLRKGVQPCRCCKTPRWNIHQREYQIKKQLAKHFGQYTFVGWLDGYVNKNSYVIINCKDHGNFETKAINILVGNTCRECARGYKRTLPGYLYVLLAEGFNTTFCGYGISNSIVNRINMHKSKLKSASFKITNLEIFTGTGEEVMLLEKQLKDTFEVNRQEIEGFRTEATYETRWKDILAIVSQKLKPYDMKEQYGN